MIRVFYGDDRIRAKQEIAKVLGNDYEVLDGDGLEARDLPAVFKGATFFDDKRRILIRDMATNKSVFELVVNYLDTPHEIVLFETKVDKRSVAYKELKDKVEFREFKLPENTDFRVVFEIFRVAKQDGKRAVKMLEKIKPNEDPIKFTGLLVSQAMKDFGAWQGVRERAVLKELARVDLEMKSTKIDPWLIVESFLLRLKTL